MTTEILNHVIFVGSDFDFSEVLARKIFHPAYGLGSRSAIYPEGRDRGGRVWAVRSTFEALALIQSHRFSRTLVLARDSDFTRDGTVAQGAYMSLHHILANNIFVPRLNVMIDFQLYDRSFADHQFPVKSLWQKYEAKWRFSRDVDCLVWADHLRGDEHKIEVQYQQWMYEADFFQRVFDASDMVRDFLGEGE